MEKEIMIDLFEDGAVKVFNTRKECVYFLIDEYACCDDDIFEEFADYVKEEQAYSTTLVQYVDGAYEHKIFQYKSLFIVDLYENISYNDIDTFIQENFNGNIGKFMEFYYGL